MVDLFLKRLLLAEEERVIPKKYCQHLEEFYTSYLKALKLKQPTAEILELFLFFLEETKKQCKNPFQFELYHKKVKRPFNYYDFGLKFVKALVDFDHSSLLGENNLLSIKKQLSQGENVILFANHQSESDPIALSILLESDFPEIGEKIISVAGERVVKDPLAIPFSMGCDLLCIYSKKYIAHPPEKKRAKQMHNQKTMKSMQKLLSTGGHIIYVAPSGGRDRKNKKGQIEVAAFDPQAIELFYLMAKKSKRPTHFYPLALYTYDLLPPPETTNIELGEKRTIAFAPIRAFFEAEFDMQPFDLIMDKNEKREKRAQTIYNIVKQAYKRLT